MITKERLEELVRQEATIYGITNYKGILKIGTKHLHHPKEFGTDKEIFDIFSCCYDDKNGTNVFNVEYSNVYETKEEAEFVARNHDTEIIEFKPPFKLNLYEEYEFNTQKGKGSITRNNFETYIVNYESDNLYAKYVFYYYQKALDYAHKLFKGEE